MKTNPYKRSTLDLVGSNTKGEEKPLQTGILIVVMTEKRNEEHKEVVPENESMMPNEKELNEFKLNSPKVNLSPAKRKNS